MPLVPSAVLVFVEDAAGNNEPQIFVNTFSADLNGRSVVRKITDLADFLHIHIRPHEDRFAIDAHSLDTAGPGEFHWRSAVRTVERDLAHACTLDNAGA